MRCSHIIQYHVSLYHVISYREVLLVFLIGVSEVVVDIHLHVIPVRGDGKQDKQQYAAQVQARYVNPERVVQTAYEVVHELKP